MYTQIQQCKYKFDLETVSSNSILLHTFIMHSTCIFAAYINICSTNLQILYSI